MPTLLDVQSPRQAHSYILVRSINGVGGLITHRDAERAARIPLQVTECNGGVGGVEITIQRKGDAHDTYGGWGSRVKGAVPNASLAAVIVRVVGRLVEMGRP